jgi:hypothetical protein
MQTSVFSIDPKGIENRWTVPYLGIFTKDPAQIALSMHRPNAPAMHRTFRPIGRTGWSGRSVEFSTEQCPSGFA